MRTDYQLIHGDNLEALKKLKADGRKFDLVELDGPYMAGLEDWDNLTEAEYIQHYADRLTLARDILQPWGVVFVFGYPEGCAEIKSWAHRSGTLHLRRWLSWYLNSTAHAGRKIQTILFFENPDINSLWEEFKKAVKVNRERMGLKIVDVYRMVGINLHLSPKVGGWLWFENDSATPPTQEQYYRLKSILALPDVFDPIYSFTSYISLTNIDFITVPPEHAKHLNDSGLRSKPVQLYLDLFRPTIPPTDSRAALILYGGSGNAGIAAAALGYDVTICETDPTRCEAIRSRWDRDVTRWQQRARAIQGSLFVMPEPEQISMDLAA